MDEQAESFPMMLYRRHLNGETAEQLAVAFEIPEERVRRRLRAAALCEERRRMQRGAAALRTNLAEI